MFVIELTYTVDLTRIDAHMTAHVRFLKKYSPSSASSSSASANGLTTARNGSGHPGGDRQQNPDSRSNYLR
jgi:hypothetical protein